jgi:shikimate kinase
MRWFKSNDGRMVRSVHARGRPVRADKVYLVGFMTAGKTTVARALGRRLSWETVDLDEEIERAEHQTVADIFAAHGEPYFRRVERAALERVLPRRHVVVATGGGTFVDPVNRAVIQADGCSIWLDISFNEIVSRLPSDGRRPLAANRSQMEALYLARREAYLHAHVRIDATGQPVEAVVDVLLDRLAS